MITIVLPEAFAFSKTSVEKLVFFSTAFAETQKNKKKTKKKEDKATKKKEAKRKARQRRVKKQLNLNRIHGQDCPCCERIDDDMLGSDTGIA